VINDKKNGLKSTLEQRNHLIGTPIEVLAGSSASSPNFWIEKVVK
jgi:hypothetical protein